MPNDIGQTLQRVALVSRGWTDDPGLPAPLRHMSRHLNRLSTNLARNRCRHPAAVRDVENLLCLICRRIQAEADDQCRRTLAHCRLLKDAVEPRPWLRF